MLNLKGGKEWEIIKPKLDESDVAYNSTLFQFSSNEILIFRGYGSSDAYMFNKDANTLVKHPAIKVKEDNFSNFKYYIHGSIWTFGYWGHAHKYDPVSKGYKFWTFDDIKP